MKGVYALSPKLGATLLRKVWKTESEICNRNIINHYALADDMETYFFEKSIHNGCISSLIPIDQSYDVDTSRMNIVTHFKMGGGLP